MLFPGRAGTSGEQHRVGGAVAPHRLPELEPSAEEGVPGEDPRFREGPRSAETWGRRCPLSRRMARTRKASRSETMSRRGQKTDGTFENAHVDVQHKQSMPLARSSAVVKATTVGSLVRRVSRMARNLRPSPAEVEGPMDPRRSEALQSVPAEDMVAVNALIRARMASEHAPHPGGDGHLVDAGGKRLRPLLTLAGGALRV